MNWCRQCERDCLIAIGISLYDTAVTEARLDGMVMRSICSCILSCDGSVIEITRSNQ